MKLLRMMSKVNMEGTTREKLNQDMQEVVMEDIMARDLLSLDMAMVDTLDLMVDMDMEVAMGEVTVHMEGMGVAIVATEVIMERERLDMVAMGVVMVVAMVEVMEEDIEEDTGDDLSDKLNFLTAFDFCD